MNLILNIIWIILGGFAIFMEYVWGGIILCLTIIGIPFGIQCFKLAFAHLTPFGKEVVKTESSGVLSFFLNIIWIIFAGIWIALTHLVLGLLLCITIVGIPFGIQHLKLMRFGFMPFGRDLVDRVS